MIKSMQWQQEYSNALTYQYQQSLLGLHERQTDHQVYRFTIKHKVRGNRQMPTLFMEDIATIYDQINAKSLGRRNSDRMHDPKAPCMTAFLDVDRRPSSKRDSGPLITEDTSRPIKGLMATGLFMVKGHDKHRFRHPPTKMYGQYDLHLAAISPHHLSEATCKCTAGIARAQLADLRFSQAYWIHSTARHWVTPEELDGMDPFYSSSDIDPYSNMALGLIKPL